MFLFSVCTILIIIKRRIEHSLICASGKALLPELRNFESVVNLESANDKSRFSFVLIALVSLGNDGKFRIVASKHAR